MRGSDSLNIDQLELSLCGIWSDIILARRVRLLRNRCDCGQLHPLADVCDRSNCIPTRVHWCLCLHPTGFPQWLGEGDDSCRFARRSSWDVPGIGGLLSVSVRKRLGFALLRLQLCLGRYYIDRGLLAM